MLFTLNYGIIWIRKEQTLKTLKERKRYTIYLVTRKCSWISNISLTIQIEEKIKNNFPFKNLEWGIFYEKKTKYKSKNDSSW